MELSNICEYSSKRIDSSLLNVENYVSTENMMQNKGGITLAAKVPVENSVEFLPGDILISNIRPYFRKIWLSDKKGGCSSDVLCIRALPGTDSTYLYYLLSQDSFFDYVMSGAKGCKMPRGDKSQIMQWDVALPNFEAQHRIASILKSIDDKIQLNNRINHNLEQQAQALYKSWFVDFEPFRGGKFVDSELGMIPEGWRVVHLDSLSSVISRGFSPKYSNSTNDIVLGQRCVRNNMIDLSVSRRHIPKYLGERELRQYDILINSTGMGSLGRVAQIYFKPERMTYDSHLTLVRAKLSNLEMYLGRNLLSRQSEIENMAVGSTGQTELPRDSVKSMSILLPTEIILKSFGDLVRAMAGRIQSNITENNELTLMRDQLLPELMSGELKINDLTC